jgi:hypothetical protein
MRTTPSIGVSAARRRLAVLMLCGTVAAAAVPAQAQTKSRFATAPGQGLKSAQVVGLAQSISSPQMKLDPLSGSFGMKHSVRQFLLLSDGSVRKGWPQGVPLDDFDAAASKRSEPQLWGSFKARVRPGAPGDYELAWRDGKPERLALEFVVLARPDERVNGFYSFVNTAQSGGGYGSSTFAHAWRGIMLKSDGRFETSRGGGVDYQNERARVSSSDQRRSAGRYRLDGSLLELRYDDGQVERRQFAFSTAKKDWIYLNGQRLLRK